MWSLMIAEGRSYDIMVRAAQLALTLDRQAPTHADFLKDDGYAPWRHLLAPSEQLALRAMADANRGVGGHNLSSLILVAQEARDNAQTNWQKNAQALADKFRQPLACHPASGISPRPPQDTWVLITGELPQAQATTLRKYQRVLAFAPYPVPPGLPALVALPPAVDTQFFSAVGRETPPAARLLVVGSGDPKHDLACISAWQKTPGCPPCALFDAYHTEALYRQWGLSASVAYMGVCTAPERAAHFRTCTQVVVADDARFCDNHFLWEAMACGARPLAHWSGGPFDAAAVWDDASRAAALEDVDSTAPTAPLPRIIDWQSIPAMLSQAPVASAGTASAGPHLVTLDPHRVRLHATGEGFLATEKKPAAGVTPVAMVAPGAAECDAAMAMRLGQYSEIYVDISEGTAFFLGCIMQILGRPVQSIDQLEPRLHQVLQRSTASEIDIVHLAHDSQRLHHHQSVLDGLAQRWGARQDERRVPTLVIHSQKPFIQTGPSKRKIGVGVATEVIVHGLDGDAHGRFQTRWLSRQPAETERGRVYFYPLPPLVGFDKDEIDYASLPGLFERDEIDMLCGIDPYLSGLVSARATWAKRAIPVVGMLHSIHPGTGLTDTVFQLTSGASLPTDTMISPTRCGADSYQAMLDAASEWLGNLMPTPPRYAGRVEVIPYGIETAHYEGLHKPACRLALDIPQDAMVLLSFGRFSRQEKADLMPMLLAFQKLHARHPQARLILAGGQQGRAYVQALRELTYRLGLGEAVTFAIDVDSSDKPLYYGAADIFVTPSDNIQETYGLTLLEAMAAGLPTIASGWDGYREIVRHGETGFLVDTYDSDVPTTSQLVLRIAEGTMGYGHRDLHESVVVDPEAMLRAMETLVQEPHLRRSMGEAGRRICRAEYEQATQSRQVGNLLLDRVREAAQSPWPVATPFRPFFDMVSERFAHYPQNGHVSPSRRLATGAWNDDGPHRAAIISSLGLTSRQEQAFIDTLLRSVAEQPGLSIEHWSTALSSPAYPASAVMLRAVRCVKYGLLRWTEETP